MCTSLVGQWVHGPAPGRAARESGPDMSTKHPLPLRAVALGGGVALALGLSTAVASAQTGSLESGFGLDIDSVLSPVGESLPEPGSLDEVVSGAAAASGAALDGARERARSALPSQARDGSSGGGSADGGSDAPGVGSLESLPAVLGQAPPVAAGSVDPGVLDPVTAGPASPAAPGPGAGPGIELGAGITAVLTMAGLLPEPGPGAPGSAGLPPLPPVG